MSAHTKGPWAHFHGGIYTRAEGPIHNGETCEECGHDPFECGDPVIITLDREIVRDVKAGHWDDCDDPLVADLKMMAVAPEFYDFALEIAVGACSLDEAMIRARQLIAKATGAAP